MVVFRKSDLWTFFLFLIQIKLSSLTDLELDSGPAGCPRRRDDAQAQGRQCLRKCKNDTDCISARKRCRCDGLCGWSCVRPDLHCDELPEIENGVLKVTGEYFGAHVMYRCNEGYWLSGERERTCQGDATWSGIQPVCKEKRNTMCGSPPEVEHARHSAPSDKNDFVINATVQYNCFPGYEAKGFLRAKCLFYNGTAKWFGPDLRCMPKSCGPSADIDNGWREGHSFTFASRVVYHCVDGFEIVGRTSRYCQANGQWGGSLPSCRPVQCEIPKDPFNGRALYTSVSFNSVVKYECRYGYKLVGQGTRMCGANKQWEGSDPTCEVIDCGPAGQLHNGYIEGRDTILGSVIVFRCFDGMKLEGSAITSTCLEDSTWSNPMPRCWAPCIVPEVEHGSVEDYPAGARVPHGQEISVKCEPRYEPASVYNATQAQCFNGTWSHVPACAPARCRQLPDKPRNGMVLAPKTEHGMKALFRCKDGFDLDGSNVTECHFGRWTSPTPRCLENYCPFPGVLENGRVLLVGYMGMYEYRSYVKKVTNNKQIMYECRRHYTLRDGPPGATCVDGQWSPKQMPRCVRGSHPVLSTQKRKRRDALLLTMAKKKRNRLRRKLSGTKRRRRGKGSKGKQRSIRELCPPFQNVDFMKIEIIKFGQDNESLAHGTVVNISCAAGYRLNFGRRRSTARCVRGRWKPKEPVCETSPCDVPTTLNGIYYRLQRVINKNDSIYHGEVLTLTCLPGYQLIGPDSLRCWYGEWSVDKYPECVPRPCELPFIPEGHYLSGYRSGLTIAHGSSVDFDCKPDYLRVSEEPIRCSEGQLRPHPPSCVHHTLKNTFPAVPQYPDNVQETDIRYRQPDGNDVSSIDFSQPSSGWRPCGPPERQQNILVYPTARPYRDIETTTADESNADSTQSKTFPHGTEVRFNCISGLTENTTWKITCEDGNWVGGAYKCESEPDPPPLEDRRNASCELDDDDPNLVAFLGDQSVSEEDSPEEFPPNTELVFRCRDIGKFSLIGSVRRKCVHGEWDGIKPSCYGLSQENDYALEKPPTILFRHQLGPIAQSNDGKLVVYPGTILHLECLWIRKYGIPHWQVSHSYRKYPEGWTNEPGRDPQLEYRLSIYHAQKDDSGRFTCVTPMGHRHSVDIVVAAIHCPTIAPNLGLRVSNPNTKMGTKVVFSCREGQTLIGSHQGTCLPSGNWSSPPPTCQVTECPDISNYTSGFLKAEITGRVVGSRATFSCPTGYGLRGQDVLQCLDSGQWSTNVPRCEEVICDAPEAPDHGYVQGGTKLGAYRGGDVLQFACHDHHMMDGAAIIVCQESGRWSAPAPKCVSACQYPGTTPGATISNVQFFYKINETVTYDCADGYILRGAKMLRCLEGGRWSSTTPTCHPARKG